MKILCTVGARPNFMKVAPVLEALRRHGHDAPLVHTGQHYDRKMSEVFFDHLGMPAPDINLGVGSASHAVQTARILEAFEPVLLEHAPRVVLVAGDVNSTIACALVAVKHGIAVAHLEAGLRSGDRSMPEEINRVLTDRISRILLTPSKDADKNLIRENVPKKWIYRVGNAMIDSLFSHIDAARSLGTLEKLGVEEKGFALMTLHRPSNVDEPRVLTRILSAAGEISEEIPVLFPVHPRTRKRINDLKGAKPSERWPNLRMLEPLGYLEFLALQGGAKLVLTDSGGIQEETTALGVPCLTLRENTERPITLSEGTNILVGTDRRRILEEAGKVLGGKAKRGRCPDLWDGDTGERVALLFDQIDAEGLLVADHPTGRIPLE